LILKEESNILVPAFFCKWQAAFFKRVFGNAICSSENC